MASVPNFPPSSPPATLLSRQSPFFFTRLYEILDLLNSYLQGADAIKDTQDFLLIVRADLSPFPSVRGAFPAKPYMVIPVSTHMETEAWCQRMKRDMEPRH